MKKLFQLTCVVLLCFVYSAGYAQAFEKKDILLSLGLGIIDDVWVNSSDGLSPVGHYNASPIRPQFMFKAEFAVHKYWGVGFISSIDGRMNMVNMNNPGSHYSELNTQLGLLVNYHFYQLIADKLNRPAKMHADKIDIYTGFTVGANMNATHIDGVSTQSPFFGAFMGLHMGIRYYATPRLSVYGEFGIGQSFFNTGITYKLSGGKKKPVVIKTF